MTCRTDYVILLVRSSLAGGRSTPQYIDAPAVRFSLLTQSVALDNITSRVEHVRCALPTPTRRHLDLAHVCHVLPTTKGWHKAVLLRIMTAEMTANQVSTKTAETVGHQQREDRQACYKRIRTL